MDGEVEVEEWRQVEGFLGYEISSLKRVRSLRRKGGGRLEEPRIIAGNGASTVKLTAPDGSVVTRSISRLVEDAFGASRFVSLSGECWKAIPGFEGYDASTLGRIRSWLISGMRGARRQEPVLIKQIIRNGYPNVTIVDANGKSWNRCVHVLVLLAHVGPPPEGYLCRHFPDPTKTNVALSNLSWAPPSVNMHDKKVHGSFRHNSRRIGPREVVAILQMRASGADLPAIQARFGISQPQAYRILRLASWPEAGVVYLLMLAAGSSPEAIAAGFEETQGTIPIERAYKRKLGPEAASLATYLNRCHGATLADLSDWFGVSMGCIQYNLVAARNISEASCQEA